MPKPERVNIQALLDGAYNAERTLRQLSLKLVKAPHGPLLDAIDRQIAAADGMEDEQERTVRLVCLTRVLRSIQGPRAMDLLIDILGTGSEEAKFAAGMLLEDLSFDRPGELHKAIERATKRLSKGNYGLYELPFVILGMGEMNRLELLQMFLSLGDPEAVSAGIEAMVELADPEAIALLNGLIDDKRTIEIEDEASGESESISLGDMARDAIEALREVENIMKPQKG